MNTTWIDVKKFIKNNLKRIIIGTLILGTLFTVLSLWLNRTSEPGPEEGTVEEIEYSTAYFQYYVERPDGVSFTNTDILKEYFTRNELLNDLTQELDLPLEQFALQDGEDFIILGDVELEETDEEMESDDSTEDGVFSLEEIVEMEQDILVFNISKGDNSHLFTFTFTSTNEELNLDTAEYFYSFVSNDEIPFYQDKNVYIFEEPQFIEDKFIVGEAMEENIEEMEGSSIPMTVISSVLLSFIIVTGFYVLSALFSSQLFYSFSYLWDENHYFLLFDSPTKDTERLTQFLSYPETNNKVYLSEGALSREIEQLILASDNNIASELPVHQSITEVKLDAGSNEIVLLVNEGETSREWYKEQQNLLSIYTNARVKIVQFNN